MRAYREHLEEAVARLEGHDADVHGVDHLKRGTRDVGGEEEGGGGHWISRNRQKQSELYLVNENEMTAGVQNDLF